MGNKSLRFNWVMMSPSHSSASGTRRNGGKPRVLRVRMVSFSSDGDTNFEAPEKLEEEAGEDMTMPKKRAGACC